MIVNKYTKGTGSGSGATEGFWNSAQTKTYVDSADTIVYASATSYADAAIAGIDLSNYSTTGDVATISGVVQEQQIVFSSGYNELHIQVMELSANTPDLSAYALSADVETLSAATAGKADAANFSVRRVRVNGNYVNYYSTTTGGVDYYFYAPANGGNAGEILVSRGEGNGAPVWSAVTIPDMAAYTPTTGFSTINGSAITEGGNLVIEGGQAPDMSAYWDSAATKTYVDSAITGVQDQLDEIDQVVPAALVDLDARVAAISGNLPDLSAYWNSATTKEYADSAATIAYDSATTHIEDIELVMSSALNEFHTQIMELSARTGPDMSDYWTSAQTKTYVDSAITGVQDQLDIIDNVIPAAIVDLQNNKVGSTSVSTIWKGTQAEYDAATQTGATADPATFYIIISNN